uniref:Vegetative incompatibility protein HET-E-1-like protein n=1 Tax=Callorhinchus milii TaxID=7868 RepID=V9KVD6_CALMI
MAEVRKLRKKLRQIERLERPERELSPSEAGKVNRKREIRSNLELLLSRLEPDVGTETVPETPAKGMERRESSDGSFRKESTDPSKVPEKQRKLERNSRDPETGGVRRPKRWSNTGFARRCLSGHHDIVTCVLLHEDRIVSGSRDTTVKVWDVTTDAEVYNLGGHTEGVTSLAIAPHNPSSPTDPQTVTLLASGSTDSNVLIWCLNSGQLKRRIYTYSPVTALIFLPLTDVLVSGSEGGKIELWDIKSGSSRFSTRGHTEGVTVLETQGALLLSAAPGDGVCVWEPRPLSLRPLWRSEAIPGVSGRPRGLSAHRDSLYVGDDGVNLKVFNWRTGEMTKTPNHVGYWGVTDCVRVGDDVIVSTAFDFESGRGFLNIRSLPDAAYLCTISSPETPRILCLALGRNSAGKHLWVTGGRTLTVWEERPGPSTSSAVISPSFYPSLDRTPVDSESETESSGAEEGETERERRTEQED